ncbi:MAG: S-ribosylhomocysteine lyase [Bacteroidaceae bacterium]|nr:S-ribosylhomocysteine lyase [Bacteroidaceae bacterium]
MDYKNKNYTTEAIKIPSFTINHLTLLRGIYVSRKDTVGNDVITTFDIRMKEPNREPALSPSALHCIEHLAATFLRNHPKWKERVIYWGPMGCLTGNYLLLRGDLTSNDILPLMRETFSFIATFEGDVPGQTPKDCGNYLLMNLPEARWEAKKYLTEVLECATEANLHYPE